MSSRARRIASDSRLSSGSSPASRICLLTPSVRQPQTVATRWCPRRAHDFADLTHGHPVAVVNDCCRQSSAFAAVFFVYVLDDLFASFMFEIDIDIWRLVPFGGYEALEQKINPGRIDGSDAQAVTDSVSRRATALAENALRSGITAIS